MLTFDQLELVQGEFRLRADIVIKPATITALMGPSGAGKSTFLSAIAGFLLVDSGEIVFNETRIDALAVAKRPVSILFQDNNLFPHLTIADNVGLGLRATLKLKAAERKHVEDVLADVGLSGLGGRKPAGLSGGQQSRAALARILLAGRPIVLLDEPFAALGPRLKEEMLDLVKSRLAGRAVIMVTHDPADTKRIADNVCVVADGLVFAPVNTVDIFANPPPALRDYLGEMG
ncbi:thiamine ABC transporter ATP-binding protein [Yoonia sp. MH D7]